jgi:predicted CoA-binding protein
LRVSYWVGAIADAVAGVAMLFPDAGGVVYGIPDFEPTTAYRYAMRLGASLMFGWTVLLLWADRKPLERRGILPVTVFVIAGLAWAGAFAVNAHFISLPNMIPTWVLQVLLTVLFLYSYFRSGRAAAERLIPHGSSSLPEAAAEFLAQKRFAVAGVSRAGNAPANLIFKKLRDSGRETYAINAVVIATHANQAIEIARQCKAAGVRHVWFHRSIDGGSYSPEAAALCATYGAMVIPGSCPMMHLEPIDVAHRCMRGVLSLTGTLPKAIETQKG